ncbi:30S ribosomal protein S17 [Candidatus Riesia pediculischaeffi]|uniref:Small ribosomal subunit protein uS17 n=2 Tax=Candidatus Riesia pediculischaeffi TaxID=428411 RepID=A0A1V0HK67_9ENTR|nr:30S ribosomal protein S17 [Candidatus Riesia pediculischaeffi]ARC53215.1 30S ribosomal protein S17 [Candidatus Riesia pediculischaeffi]KIE64136.1 SSU ribosomal protein S17p (S11e) [Candidatus Riesia pediculischaeffi PTSU]
MRTNKSPKKTLKAYVINNTMNKSALVRIKKIVKHPLYKKYIKKTTQLQVHDERNTCSIGDVVEIKETRPISKRKSWSIVSILKQDNPNSYR